MPTIRIDNLTIAVDTDMNIIDAARLKGIEIPTLGYDPRVSPPSTQEIAIVELIEGDNTRFVPATSTPVREGMVIRTQSGALHIYRTIYLEALLRYHYGDCQAPCMLRCPAGIDIQRYLYHAAAGNFLEAIEVIKERNPLPLVCGRVCPHPCEDDCRRSAVDTPVNINGVKRFLADCDRMQAFAYKPSCRIDTGKRVAVVGAGPAGLTAAYFLRRLGHKVTIFEMQEAGGGMLRWGIPDYRLPQRLLDEEIRSILDLGVEIRYHKRLGRDFSVASLKHEGFDAVFIGLGAQKASAIGVPGEDLPGVMSGLDFLARLARGERPAVGERVIVIGGGNTAMDAARSAVRLGAKDVTIAYRRTRQEMPAQASEIDEALEEGVAIYYLIAPLSIQAEGPLLRLNCTRMELGEADKSGRRRPVPVAGSEFTLSAHTIISAIGQAVDGAVCGDENLLDKWGNIKADTATLQTMLPGVFAGGDCVTGPGIAVSAIGAGRRAADAIDQYLRTGQVSPVQGPYTCSKGHWRNLPPETFRDAAPAIRIEIQGRDPRQRVGDFEESTSTWDKDSAMAEASRCLACGCSERYACDLRNYASRYGIRFDPTQDPRPLAIDENHPIIRREPGKCILCGLCLKVCREYEGVSALSFTETGNVLSIGPNENRPLDLTTCVACGHCAAVCPTGALTIKPVLPMVYRSLNDPALTVVAQIAPAVRAAIGQHYGLVPQEVMPRLAAGLKCLGFDFVFDTCWAADLTIMEEGTEFLSRLAEGGVLPQITSCCPAWINYCEKVAPDILPHLSSCKSPQQMFGAVMKRYFAKVLDLAPELLYFVSIMPCNAKKYEAGRPEFSTGGLRDVDSVLTTNDVIAMFSERHIDPRQLEPGEVDAFFGKVSGAGIIFGASGGVAEAALRMAALKVTGMRLDGFHYDEAPEHKGVKETMVSLGDTPVRLAVVSGLQNAQHMIDRLRAGDAPYDLIEVMACPGGCINGSGNPTPQLVSEAEYRLDVLYRLDQSAPIRISQDNPTVRAIYENWLGEPDSASSHATLHTTYQRRSMQLEEAQVAARLKTQPAIDVGVCIGTNCYLKGSWKLLESLAAELRRRGLSGRIRVRACFCTGKCADGPNVVVGGRAISGVDPAHASSFIDTHLMHLLEEEAPMGAS